MSYEDIIVANNHAHQFRRKRHGAAELFGGGPPLLIFDDRAFELKDISGSGAAAFSSRATAANAPIAIDQVGELRLVQAGEELFSGRARLVRTQQEGVKSAAGFALEGSQFDLDQLRRKNVAAQACNAPHRDFDGIASEYRAFCADTMSFIAGYLNFIDRDFAPIEDGMSVAESNDIARQLCRTAAPGWRAIVEQGNNLVIPIHGAKRLRLAYKEYTERVLTRTLLEGEGWRRTYEKPLGYPGDYCIMNYIYNGVPIGKTVRSKFLHLLSLVGAEPVKTRMERLSQLIVERARMAPGAGPNAVLTIGAGPTREAEEILRLAPRNEAWSFTLVDQEDAALEYSLSAISDLRFGPSVTAIAHHASFKEMLDPTPLAEAARNCSVVYSSGLIDYLNPLAAVRFVKRTYELLRPGASIIIGNVNDKPSGMIWPSEYVVDWSLFFRSREEMLAMAKGIEGAEVVVETDSLDAIYFLLIRKPV